MRIASNDDLPWRPQAILNDDVVQTSIAAVEEIFYPMLGSKPSNLVQCARCFFCCR
jgi:hypothetical protein